MRNFEEMPSEMEFSSQDGEGKEKKDNKQTDKEEKSVTQDEEKRDILDNKEGRSKENTPKNEELSPNIISKEQEEKESEGKEEKENNQEQKDNSVEESTNNKEQNSIEEKNNSAQMTNEEDNKEKNGDQEENSPKEDKESKKEAKEEKELQEYMENVVFKELGLTPQDEEKELNRIKKEIKENPEKVPAVMEEATKRSFNKTRKYLTELFQLYSYEGGEDKDTYLQTWSKIFNQEAAKWNKIVDEEIKKVNELKNNDTEVQHNDKTKENNKEINKYDKLIEEEARKYVEQAKQDAKIDNTTLEEEARKYKFSLNKKYKGSPTDLKYLTISTIWGEQLENITRKRAREECTRVKIPREEILKFLKEDIQTNGDLAQVSININPQDLISWIEHGRKIPASEATDDHQIITGSAKLMNSHNVTPSQELVINKRYITNREKLEMKYIFNGHYPVYGALAMNSKERKIGAAKSYGDIAVFLNKDKIKDRVTFTSQDSLDSEEIADFTYKHAIIIKSIYDFLSEKIPDNIDFVQDYDRFPLIHSLLSRYSLYKINNQTPYVEAQILGGVTNNDIDKIKIPRFHNPDDKDRIESFIKEFKNKYPEIAKEKLQIIDT